MGTDLGVKAGRVFEFGGYVAAVVLIAFGVAALVLGFDGRSTVSDNLANEFIVGTPDMTPSEINKEIPAAQASQKRIAAERRKAGSPAIEFTPVSAPGCSVAGEAIDNGTDARCFAQYLRIHALISTGGLTYSQMGRYLAKPDAPAKETDFAGGTDNPQWAVMDAKSGQPAANGARNLWVTATALSSALNLAYTAEQIALFGMVVGIALLLSGIGFLILAVFVLHKRSPAAEEKGPAATELTATPAH